MPDKHDMCEVLEAPINPFPELSPLRPQPNEDYELPKWPLVHQDKDGLLHGHSICDLIRTGDDYYGTFENGYPHGSGTWRWFGEDRRGHHPFPGSFVGEWEYAKPVRGVYEWGNGDRYEGELKEGEAWEDPRSNFHGQGKYTHANGDYYEGKWINGHRAGGIYYFSDGHQLEVPASDEEIW
jgi:hypothetical protein